MKKLILLVACLSFSILFVACSQNSKRSKSDGSVPQAIVIKGTGEEAGSPDSTMGIKPPSTQNADVLLPEISAKYKGVVINVISVKDGKIINEVVLPFKKKTAIKGTPYSILVDSFFTTFKMDEKGVINSSMEEVNPATKVKLYKDDKVVFDGWLFQNYPDIHQFTDPEYSFVLLKGDKK